MSAWATTIGRPTVNYTYVFFKNSSEQFLKCDDKVEQYSIRDISNKSFCSVHTTKVDLVWNMLQLKWTSRQYCHDVILSDSTIHTFFAIE